MMPATDDEALQANPKRNYVLLTNLGSESEFAKFNSRLKISGGIASVTTLLRKSIVATNAFLVDSEFLEMSTCEKYEWWKWARPSDKVKPFLKWKRTLSEQSNKPRDLLSRKKSSSKRTRTIRPWKF